MKNDLKRRLLRLGLIRLCILLMAVTALEVSEWLRAATRVTPFNVPKVILLYPFCLTMTLWLYPPETITLASLTALWAWSLLMTVSMYHLMPGD